jgi:hypothetical protein
MTIFLKILLRDDIQVRGMLAVSKQIKHTSLMEMISLKKLGYVTSEQQYCVEISNRFASSGNSDTEVDISRA